jgi:hypothetical protein
VAEADREDHGKYSMVGPSQGAAGTLAQDPLLHRYSCWFKGRYHTLLVAARFTGWVVNLREWVNIATHHLR